MKLALDYIGAAGNNHGNYIKVMCKHHPPGWAAGFLCEASGWRSGLIAARALAETGKCPVMRFHGLWLDSHKFTNANISPAVKWANRIVNFHQQYPEIKLYYSPWLEPYISSDLMRECKRACKKILPKEIGFVQGKVLPHGINEAHHSMPISGKYIYSYDGSDCLHTHTGYMNSVKGEKHLHEHALLFFLWTPHCNGKKSVTDTTAREDRTAWLTARDMKRMIELMEG